jgi:photosystem II stability/assembly factor-like uncharacterized protein
MRFISYIILRKIRKNYLARQKVKNRNFIINKLRVLSSKPSNLQITVKRWRKYSFPDNVYCLCITSNANNTYMFAITTCGIYISNDLGFVWTSCFSTNTVTWYCICSDITGQYIIASAKINNIEDILYRKSVVYYSDNYGQTWNLSSYHSQMNENDYLISIKYTDRQTFVLLSMNGYIYESTDYGKNWNTLSVIDSWCSSVTYNNKLLTVACGYANGGIYLSDDRGVLWVKQTDIKCKLLSASFSCQYLACICNSNPNGGIYVSNDYGAVWNRTLPLCIDWTSITMDYTGKSIYASSSNKGIYFSDNYGVSWIKLETNTIDWNCSIVNNDGTRLVASTLNYSTKVSDIYVYE